MDNDFKPCSYKFESDDSIADTDYSLSSSDSSNSSSVSTPTDEEKETASLKDAINRNCVNDNALNETGGDKKAAKKFKYPSEHKSKGKKFS